MGGVPIAVIESKCWSLRSEYHLHIAPGLNSFVVVALVICLRDERRHQGGAAGAGLADGAGAGA